MNEHNHSNYSKRIATNTLVLFARMLIITIVNLYTVRWVLKGLGTEDYGIYNAVAGVVTTGTCISSVFHISGTWGSDQDVVSGSRYRQG